MITYVKAVFPGLQCYFDQTQCHEGIYVFPGIFPLQKYVEVKRLYILNFHYINMYVCIYVCVCVCVCVCMCVCVCVYVCMCNVP